MNGILKDKVVIVTGGASGLGRATCIAAAEQGARAVLVADVLAEPREGGEPTHTMVQSIGSEGRFIETDVTNRSQVDALVSAAEDFGGVDVMVANAGITVASDDADVSEEDIDRMMSVNVKGVLLCAQAAARQLKTAHKPGSIVLTASMGGLQGSPHTVAYSTSKGGVIVMAKALAGALGPDGIRVNSVSPGLIETHMLTTTPGVAEAADGMRQRTPLRRLGQPSEIGDVIVWLGSDLSSYVTGASIVVDGGLTSVI